MVVQEVARRTTVDREFRHPVPPVWWTCPIDLQMLTLWVRVRQGRDLHHRVLHRGLLCLI